MWHTCGKNEKKIFTRQEMNLEVKFLKEIHIHTRYGQVNSF